VRPVSEDFLTTVRGSHKIFTRVKVITTYQEGLAPTGTAIDVVDGDVRADAKADVRQTVDLTTRGDRRWPDVPTDLLTPYGNELFVERGVDFGNGTVEIVSFGYFRINSVDQDDGPDGEIKLAGSDRMIGLIDGRIPTPITFTTGTSLTTVFETLVHEIYPDATILFDFAADESTFDTQHVAEQDRYKFLNELAKAQGKVMYWDHRGQLRIESPLDPSSPVWEVNSGEDGILVKLQRELTRDGVYNAVVATGETTDESKPPVTAIVYDVNPDSPTYWEGRFGKVPRFYSSSFLTTVENATAAARSILLQAIGLPYNVNFQAVPNPALEVFDPIKITSREGSVVHVIDTLSTPLTADGVQTGTTRARDELNVAEETT
jgi:Domain of unknown function (DUF5047)